MNIWLINNYNMPPELGPMTRQYYFAKHLKRMGHNPVVFVGSKLHNTNIQMIPGKENHIIYDGCKDFPYVFLRILDYKESKIKRVYTMFEFYFRMMRCAKDFPKPDVVLGSSAHPLAALAAIRLAKKYKCKSIMEVRDLWPESFVAYGIMSRKNPLLKVLYAGEKWLYKKADKLIFTMEGGKDYIIEKGWDKEHGGPIDLRKVHHINNGVDLEDFNYNKENYTFEDPDLDDPDTFKVVYIGSIRLANGLDQLLTAAEYLKSNKRIKFIIYGSGPELELLMLECEQKNINNVVFKGRVEKMGQ